MKVIKDVRYLASDSAAGGGGGWRARPCAGGWRTPLFQLTADVDNWAKFN